MAPIDLEKPYGEHIRPWGFYTHLRNMGYPIDVLQYTSIRMVFKNAFRLIVRRSKIVLISGVNPRSALLFAFVCKLFRRAVVVDMHGSAWYECSKWGKKHKAHYFFLVESILLRFADSVTTVSEDLRLILKLNFNVRENKIKTVPTGVNVDSAESPKKIDKRIGNSSQNLIVLSAPRNFYSNILAVKFAYKVMAYLKKHDARAVLFITGGGNIIEDRPSNITYTGNLNFRKYNDLLESADCAIAPYPEEAVCGGVRNKILEYWAHRLLVISTKTGVFGIPEAVAGENFVFGGYDPNSFARTMLETLKFSFDRRKNIAENGYATVKEKYNWERQAKKMFAVLSAV